MAAVTAQGMTYDLRPDNKVSNRKHTLRIYLPQPPYGDVSFPAHRLVKQGIVAWNFAVGACVKLVVQRRSAARSPPMDDCEQRCRILGVSVGLLGVWQGRILGPGGKTLSSMVEHSGAGMEVHDKHGHLNGRHPDPLDTELHVLCFADSMVSS